MDSDLGKNDPYRGMESAKDNIRPDFLGGTDDEGEADLNDKQKESAKRKLNEAQKEFAEKEELASKTNVDNESFYRPDDGITETRQEEEKAGGLYAGEGKKPELRKGRFKGKIKKRGPITGIILTIFGFGAFSFVGVSTEIIAWKENITAMFGQNSAVMNTRSNYIMRRLLDSDRATVGSTIFGKNKFTINSRLASKLRAQNIEYASIGGDGSQVRILVFKDENDINIPIVADTSDLPKVKTLINDSNGELDINGVTMKLGEPITLTQARRTNQNFEISYDTATITFTGKIAGWFDDMADSLFERIVGKKARNQVYIDNPTKEKVNDLMLSNSSMGVDNSDLSVQVEVEVESEDEDGNPITERQRTNVQDTDRVSGDGDVTFGQVKSQDGKIATDGPNSEAVKTSLTSRAQKAAMVGSNLGCAFVQGIGSITIAIGAIQTINVISNAAKYLEIADRIKAGDANNTVNLALENLGTVVKTTAYDINGQSVDKEGSVTSSPGWNAVFARKNIINENDPMALMVNREYVNKIALNSAGVNPIITNLFAATGEIGAGIEAFRFCNGFQLAGGIIDAISDVALLFSTAGVGKFIKEFIKGVIEGVKLSAVMSAVSIVISLITPVVTRWFANHLSTVFLGLPGGYSLLSGATNILNSNFQMSTGRYANRENTIEVFGLTRDVEQEWAAYERATKSPFDVSSKYTFLGSIVNSVLPIINTSSGNIFSSISSVINLAGTSAVAMINPSVSAASDMEDFTLSLASDNNCTFLHSVGVAGDFACNKYVGAYVNELSTEDPGDIYQRMDGYGSFDGTDSDGNPIVNKNSDYAKYIVACVTSDTQPGTMSSAVEGFLQKISSSDNAIVGGLVNFGANFVPFEGFLDAISAVEQNNNMKWNSGLACTGNTGNADFDQKIKDFSMYNLDQRVLNNMGIIDNNSTVAFLDDYYEENPIDYSYEGQIARVSGMNKEQVEDTLALMEYYQFLDEYDPSERLAFVEPKETKEIKFDNDYKLAQVFYVLTNQISYNDIRNRTFAV